MVSPHNEVKKLQSAVSSCEPSGSLQRSTGTVPTSHRSPALPPPARRPGDAGLGEGACPAPTQPSCLRRRSISVHLPPLPAGPGATTARWNTQTVTSAGGAGGRAGGGVGDRAGRRRTSSCSGEERTGTRSRHPRKARPRARPCPLPTTRPGEALRD